MLGLLALITGILAMHTGLVTGHGSADATPGGHPSGVSPKATDSRQNSDADPAAAVAHIQRGTPTHDSIASTWAGAPTALTHAHHLTDPPVSGPGSAGAPTAFSPAPGCADCDDNHAGLHACVFILTMLALAVALVVLYRLAVDRPGGGVTRPRHWRPRRERSPPWTVLSLAELSILRI